MDTASKIVLFSKNPNILYTMASTTKIMTALVALEHYKLDDILLVISTNAPPAVVGYPLGERVRFIDMLYGMLLPSGNDAAVAIAQNYPGGEKAFIQRMNDKAKELGLFQTHFNDSSGLDNGNYTTPKELAYLTTVALQHPIFSHIVSSKEKLTTNVTGNKRYPLVNLNQLLGSYGVNGVKTGFTPDAGGMLVTSSTYNGHTLVYVVMKSDDRFGDTEKLLEKTYGKINYLMITP
jgi:D-alanyl-D-alanine carboxypeptidase (penicillin-binding protein 5/6)